MSFQVRVNYDPALELDRYSNGTLSLFSAYTDSLAMTYPEYSFVGQFKRDSVFNVQGHYGITDVTTVELKLLHLNPSWAPISEHVETVYSSMTGVNSGRINYDFPVPADFDLTADFPDDIFLIQTVVTYSGSSPFWNAFVDVVDVVVPKSVEISADTLYVNVGHADTASATVYPMDAEDKVVTWESLDESVVTIDAMGIMEGIAEGEAKIVVTTNTNSVTDTSLVIVMDLRATGVSLDQTEVTLSIGESVTLVATVMPENAEDKTVGWSSSDDFAATVDENGVVTGVSVGTATITVTTNSMGHTAECAVTVSDATAINGLDLEGVSIYPNPANSEINISGLETGKYEVEVISILGSQQLRSSFNASENMTISIETLPAGTYLLKITGETGVHVQKLNKY